MTSDVWAFTLLTIPTMIVLGMRHGLDIDHITAIDNLVRLHDSANRSRWVGAAFGIGHMLSVLVEMLLIICLVGSATDTQSMTLWGGMVGAITLGAIGMINIYSMKKWGRSGSAVLASKMLAKSGILGPFASALITGMVFGLGFDTATQISAITLSAVASAAAGVQVALVLAGFFAAGMIPLDTLDSILLRSAFSKMFDTRGFRYVSYALSGSAMAVAASSSFGLITKIELLPEWGGPALASSVIAVSVGYTFIKRRKKKDKSIEDRRSITTSTAPIAAKAEKGLHGHNIKQQLQDHSQVEKTKAPEE